MITHTQEEYAIQALKYMFAEIDKNDILLDDDMRSQEEIVDEYLEEIRQILEEK